MSRIDRDPGAWATQTVSPGERAEVNIIVSQSYAGTDIRIPVYVWRGAEAGPTVFVAAAVHGDEINGAGAIRRLIAQPSFELIAGTLLLVPVVNLLGYERHSRYLPDRRDLNRSFPGTRDGSLASRLARTIFDQIVQRSDYGIDLHTAAVRRTNFPNVRADMSDPAVADFARAFGAELIIDGKGPKGSLRQAAVKARCPTVILEAGEIWKIEPTYVEYAARGVRSCLKHLGMIEGEPERPPYCMEVSRTHWMRARHGGLLRFHVGAGDIVRKGDPVATNTSLTGREFNVMEAPRDAVVLGMTTLPAVAPGDPVFHLAYPSAEALEAARRVRSSMGEDALHQRARMDLASNVLITPPTPRQKRPRRPRRPRGATEPMTFGEESRRSGA